MAARLAASIATMSGGGAVGGAIAAVALGAEEFKSVE
jgi:hypothetical protein